MLLNMLNAKYRIMYLEKKIQSGNIVDFDDIVRFINIFGT